MARKEIEIFMDSKEVSNFLKVIDWSMVQQSSKSNGLMN